MWRGDNIDDDWMTAPRTRLLYPSVNLTSRRLAKPTTKPPSNRLTPRITHWQWLNGVYDTRYEAIHRMTPSTDSRLLIEWHCRVLYGTALTADPGSLVLSDPLTLIIDLLTSNTWHRLTCQSYRHITVWKFVTTPSLELGLVHCTVAYVVTSCFGKQESWAIAKMTARCALCMYLKIFRRPWLRPRLLFPKFLMGFCADWSS